MAEKTLFQKIADRELPAEILFEDDRCIAIRDINPVAPTHVLVIPREPVAGVQDLEDEHAALAGHLLVVARRLAEQAGLDGGYRLVLNVGDDAGQTVPHLHLHVLGGRRMAWPPGLGWGMGDGGRRACPEALRGGRRTECGGGGEGGRNGTADC